MALPEGFDLFWFIVYSRVAGSLEWLTVEHPIAVGVAIGIGVSLLAAKLWAWLEEPLT